MVLPNILSRCAPHPWGLQSVPLATSTFAVAKSYSSSGCGFIVCPSALSPLAMTPLSTSTTTTKLHSTNKSYSAEWIDLLSHESYSTPSTTLPKKIDPPRSGAVSFSTPSNDKLFTFAGYAEIDSASASSQQEVPPERYVVNDLWQFVPYPESTSGENSSWGWTQVLQKDEEYIPGPRLATAIAVLPSSTGNDANNLGNSQAVLLGGWDPQTPGTGGVILDDASFLDLDSLEWSQLCTASENKEEEVTNTIPGGPTSRHVAVPLSIKCPEKKEIRNTICLHNHRCEDHVLLLSTTTNDDGKGKKKNVFAQWEHQPTTGDAPSSRGLHCAAQLNNKLDNTSKAMVIFGGAAKDGFMSNEAFVLDVGTWRWKRLDCDGGDGNDDVPSPRAGACLCPLDENSVVLFGGASPGENGGLEGLNDVWVLHVDMEGGKGKWQCLSSNQNNAGDGQVDNNVCPPGRNAAALSEIDAAKLLPNNLAWKQEDKEKECVDFLLQGGWYPFRKTYNDAFLLRISSN